MKNVVNFTRKCWISFVFMLCITSAGFGQTITMSTGNCVATADEIQFDLFVTNTGAASFQYNSTVIRLTHSAAILAPGTNTIVFSYVGDSDFPLSWPPNSSPAFIYTPATRLFRVSTNTGVYLNGTGCAAPNILSGETKKIGRFSLKNTAQNFVPGANVGLAWGTSGMVGYLNCAQGTTVFTTASGNTILNAPCSMFIPGCISSTVNGNPGDQTICNPGTAIFTGSFTGGIPAPTIVWQVQTGGVGIFTDLTEAAPYSNTTTNTLTITDPTLSLSTNRYRLKASSICGDVFTNDALLTVNANVNAGTVSGISPLCISPTGTSYSSDGDGGGTWSSSNPLVASVDAAGLVTALSAGTTDITYTINTGCGSPLSSFKTLTVNANVNAGTVNGISPLCISPTGTSYSSDGDGGGTWSSSNPLVASVDAAGLVTALSAGTTDITYTINTGCGSPLSSFKTLTVNPNVNAGTVSGISPLCISPTGTSYSSDGDGGGTWSSSNPLVASVDAAGLVTALSAGTSDITYTINTGCGSPLSSFKTLTVNPNANPGTVSGPASLCTLTSGQFTSDGDAGGIWSSTNILVATIDAGGMVTAGLVPGTTDITYTVNSGCNNPQASSKTLTVSLLPDAGTVSGTSPLCIGATTTYTSDGTGTGTWSSTNPSVATVNLTTGEVTTLAAGTTDITYTVTGCLLPATAFKTLTVDPIGAGTVSGSLTLCTGSLTTFSTDGSAGGTWSSTNTTVATVDASTGIVTALSAGTTDITYTAITGCNIATPSFKTLTVTGSAQLAGVVGGAQVCTNATIQPAAAQPSGTSYSDGSCNTIATILPSGLAQVSGNIDVCVRVEDVVHTYHNIPYVQRVYDITPVVNAANATATITLYYTQGEFDAFNAARGIYPAMPTGSGDAAGIANFRITQFHGTGTYPGNYNGGVVDLINPDDTKIVWSGLPLNRWEVTFDVNGFSGFYAFTNLTNTPLPISLVSFSGRNNGSINLLEWTTSSEQNSNYFELERSIDGINFVKAGTIAAAGNSSTNKNYNFNDNISSFTARLFYYRLKQVDITGLVKYSTIVKIKLGTKGFNVEASPNPFVDQLRVQVDAVQKENAVITLNSLDGRKILKQNTSLSRGSNVILLDKLDNLPGGVYLLTVVTDSEKTTVKVIKQK